MVVIPAETTYSEIELDLIDNEPPGLFPQGQDSLWGQVRHLFADYLQTQFLDIFTAWYSNLDPRTVDANDIAEWETEVGLPSHNTVLTLQQRRAGVATRLHYGAFTRAARIAIVESFVASVLGDATLFTIGGIPFTPAGITLFSGASSTAGLYTITEDIPNFHYTVTVDPSAGIDSASLIRALSRVTPAHISFNIVTADVRSYGSGTYGSGTYGG